VDVFGAPAIGARQCVGLNERRVQSGTILLQPIGFWMQSASFYIGILADSKSEGISFEDPGNQPACDDMSQANQGS
jgi:hypothetical protein